MAVSIAFAIATLCHAAGCGGQSFTQQAPAADAGVDAVVEAGPDALPDVAQEAPVDSPPEAAADVVVEAAGDVGTDAVVVDAAADAAPPNCSDTMVPNTSCTTTGMCAVQSFVGAQEPVAYKFGLTLDDAELYWAEQDDYNGIGTGAIKRLGVGAADKTPEVFSTTHPRPFSVTLDKQHVYWLSHAEGTNGPRLWGAKRDCPVPCQGTLIKEYPLWSPSAVKRVGGDRMFVLFKEQVDVLSGAGLTWTSETTQSSGEYPSMAVAREGVYTATVRNATIHLLSIDGTLDTPFAMFAGGDGALEPGPVSLASTCSSLYALAAGQSLWELDKANASQKQLVTGLGESLWGMAADARFVYVHRANAGGVTRIERASGVAKELAQGNVWSIAVGPSFVYFDDHNTGAIKRIVK